MHSVRIRAIRLSTAVNLSSHNFDSQDVQGSLEPQLYSRLQQIFRAITSTLKISKITKYAAM